MNKRQLGTEYEEKVIAWLEEQHVKVLEHSYRCRQGEIDIILKDGEYLIFAEVKYRRTENYGSPMEAVSYAKQRKICRVSDFYRMKNGIGEFESIRFDVISICGNEIEWIKNAFMYC